MRVINRTACNFLRRSDGKPLAEVILQTHDGTDSTTRGYINHQELRFVADGDALFDVIQNLQKALSVLERANPSSEVREELEVAINEAIGDVYGE